MSQRERTRDLTQGSIAKNIINIALPSSIGAFFTTMYNLVDNFWAGKLGINLAEINSISQLIDTKGEINALSALSISFPIFLLIVAVSNGTMSGTVSLVGNALGAKKQKQAKSYFIQALFYSLMTSVVMIVSLLFFLPQLLGFFAVKEQQTINLAIQYISAILYGSFLFSAVSVCNANLIARGETKIQRNIYIITFFMNIILDPLFMFGYGFIPAFGIKGLAYATLISQAFGLLVIFFKLSNSFQVFKGMTKIDFKPKINLIIQVAKQSIPQTINIGMVSFVLGFINYSAGQIGGEQAIAAFGIATKIEQIALIPSIGILTAISCIASQNNGANLIHNVQKTYQISLFYGLFLLMVVMIPLAWIFSKQLISIFTSEHQVIAIAMNYLKVASITFYSYMLINFSVSIFQAVKKPYLTICIGLLRNVILVVPAIKLYTEVFDFKLNGIWYSMLSNNWLAAILSVIMYFVVINKRLKEVKLIKNHS